MPFNKAKQIIHSGTGIFEGIRACLEKQCLESALILALSAIDQMAWLSLPNTREEVTKTDYIEWADRYVVPGSSLECTGNDLYGARCGLVHSLTPDSKLAKQGKAARIAYSFGNRAPYPRAELERLGVPWIMLHIETLCNAVLQGALKFWEDVERDQARLDAVNRKAESFFRPDATLPARLPSP